MSKMEKSIFEIALHETIVFSSEEIDTVISFTGSGLKWWFSIGKDNKFSLSDTLDIFNDENRAPIAYARKLAKDWFEWELKEFAAESQEDSNFEFSTNNVIQEKSTYPAPDSSEKNFPIVEPPELDADKKDAHTEHCCEQHLNCKFKNVNCTVVLGKKKSSYPCTCNKTPYKIKEIYYG